ncbi:MAG: chemotaxis protein CheW [Phycisphaerales bacterium]|nr:chemotaxis protein CheW [Phycisphaerales bacterium]
MANEHLVFELGGERFAVPVGHVLGLIKYEPRELRRPFGEGEALAGFLVHQGRVIPVVELRTLLGMRSMATESEEVLATLEQRKQDHINWLDELETSVHENRAFRLTTDPHACKFGKWYDSLMSSVPAVQRFTNGSGPLEGVLRAFDQPHQRIHAIALDVARLMETGDQHGALGVIQHSRNGDLSTMVSLFDRAKDMFVSLRRTLLLILELRGERIGVLIDQVQNMRALLPEHMQSVTVDSRMITGMAMPSAGEAPVAVMDVEGLYSTVLPAVEHLAQ